jgi:CHASE2 domain-containing sensor protein
MADPGKKPSLLQVVWSVAASFFGVQSARARVRDFKHGRAGVFIAVGLVMTALFVVTVILIVKLVLKHAGAG